MLWEAVNNQSNSSSFWRPAGCTLPRIAQTGTGLHTLAAGLTRVPLAISAGKGMASCTQEQSQDAVITNFPVNFNLSETFSLFLLQRKHYLKVKKKGLKSLWDIRRRAWKSNWICGSLNATAFKMHMFFSFWIFCLTVPLCITVSQRMSFLKYPLWSLGNKFRYDCPAII